jgi:ribulose kinase
MRQVSESLSAKVSQLDREKSQFLEKNNYFFEIQKHVTFVKAKEMSEEQLLSTHSAILFTNTLDISMNNAKVVLQGQK